MADNGAEGRLVIGTKRYSSWSLRGWLAVHLAGLDVEEVLEVDEGRPLLDVAPLSASGNVPLDEDDELPRGEES